MTATTVSASNRALKVLIDNVKTTGKAFEQAVHDAMVAIVVHALGVGNFDVTAAGRLVEAMPNTTRRTQVIKHFSEYSPIRIVKNAKKGATDLKASMRRPEDDGYNAWNLEGLKANPWFAREELKKDPEFDLHFSTVENKVWAFIQQLTNMAEAKVSVLDAEGREVKMNKITEHDQHRVKFLAASIKSALKAAKEAPLDTVDTDTTTTDTAPAEAPQPLTKVA